MWTKPHSGRNTRQSASRDAPREELLDTPYAGLLLEDVPPDRTGADPNAGRKKGERAVSAPHLLVSARTGGGKSRSALGPAVVSWGPRPVVAMSSKGDIAELTIRQRACYGPIYLMDLSGEVRDSEIGGVPVTRVASDPCALITTDDQALDMATLLLDVGAQAGAGESTGSGSSGDPFWASLAMRPLAAFLRAGGWYPDPQTGEMTWGGGIRWVLRALDVLDAHAPSAKDADGDGDADEDDDWLDLITPSWDTVVARCAVQGSRHGDSVTAAKAMDARQRDSIGINARVALTPWVMDAVTGDEDAAIFTPAMLESKGATLYIVAPVSGSAAAAATAVISQTVDHWRKGVGRLDVLEMVLDELPNSAPLPALARYVGEARGLGVRIVAAVQATAQFGPRWGESGLKILRDIFPAVLVYPNAAEKDLLEAAAWSAGLVERSTSSTDASGRSTRSHERSEAIQAAELLPTRPGTARLLVQGGPGILVEVPDISRTDLRAESFGQGRS